MGCIGKDQTKVDGGHEWKASIMTLFALPFITLNPMRVLEHQMQQVLLQTTPPMYAFGVNENTRILRLNTRRNDDKLSRSEDF